MVCLWFIGLALFLQAMAGVSIAAPVLSTGYSWQTVLEQNDRTLTYSFDMTGGYAVEGFLSQSLDEVFTEVPGWKNAIRQSLESWELAADIKFVEETDSGDPFEAYGARGDIRFSAHPIANALAHGFPPLPTGTTEAVTEKSDWGDIHYNPDNGDNPDGQWDAFYLRQTTTHELGHALGITSHNLNPNSAMFGLGGINTAVPTEHDLADLRALYFPQNAASAPVFSDPEIDGRRSWAALVDGSAENRAVLTLTEQGAVVTSGEQKTGIKGVGLSLSDENYGFDFVDLVLQAGGSISTEGHNAYGIGAGDHNRITVNGSISTQGFSADGIALMGLGNSLRTEIESLIRTSGAGANGIFAGGELDLAGYHGNEIVAGGRIETSGDGGCGIYAAGFSTVTLTGSILTLGRNAAGIGSDQYGSQVITVDEPALIETRGHEAYGLLVRGADNVVTMQGTISTVGEDSYGIHGFWSENSEFVMDGTIRTTGSGAGGLFFVGNQNQVTVSGSILTGGESAHAVYGRGSNNTLISTDTLLVTGPESRGLSVYAGSNNRLENRGSLQTAGGEGYGLYTNGSSNTLINEGSISTFGPLAHGLYAYGSSNTLFNDGSISTFGGLAHGFFAYGTLNRLENQGTVMTFEEKTHGILASGSGNSVLNGGSLLTSGDLGYGLFVSGSGNHAINAGDIATAGRFAHGMAAGGGGNVLLHNGHIETGGGQAFGLFVREGNNVVEVGGDVISRQADAARFGSFWDSEARTVEQTTATGNLLLLHGSPEITGDIVNDGADGGATVYFGIALDDTAPAGYVPAATELVYDGNFTGRLWQGEVMAGSVRLNGTSNAFSTLSIHSWAILGGNTTLAGDLINRGLVSPGNSIGTIALAGDYLQEAGGALLLEIAGSTSDQVLVGGDATFLDGSSLILEPIAPVLSGDFTLVTAGGALYGIPLLVPDASAILDFSLQPDTRSLSLQVDRASYTGFASEDNQRRQGFALDNLVPEASGDLAAILLKIDQTSDPGGVTGALDALTPVGYTALPDAAFSALRRFVEGIPSFEDSIGNNDSTPEPWAGYARSLFWETEREGADGIAGYRISGGGLSVGANRQAGDLQLGVALGYQKLDINHQASRTAGRLDLFLAALHGTIRREPWFVRGILAYGHQREDYRRDITFLDLSRSAESDSKADLLMTGLVIGRRWDGRFISLTPFAGADFATYLGRKFDEHGAGDLNLEISDRNQQSLRHSLGLTLTAPIPGMAKVRLDSRLSVGWSHEWLDDAYDLQARLSGEKFRIEGKDLGRDLLTTSLGLQARLGERVEIEAGIDYERRQRDEAYGARISLGYRFF